MKTKKILRSCLAIICCMSMILGCVGAIAPEVKAAEQMPTGFTEVTPREFGIADFSGNTEVTKYTSSLKPIQSADKVMIKANVIFGTGGIEIFDKTGSGSAKSGIWIGRQWSKLRIANHYSDGKLYVGGKYVDGVLPEGVASEYYYDMNPLGKGTLYDTTEISLTITIEVVNCDGGNSADDLKIGVWFDEVLYNGTYIYFCNAVVGNANIYMDVSTLSCTSPQITQPEQPEPEQPEEPEVVYTEVTPRDFGIQDFSGNTEKTQYTSSLKPIQSADKIMFKANVIFGSGGIEIFDKTGSNSTNGGVWIGRTWNQLRITNHYSDGLVYVGGKFVDGVYTDGSKAYYYDMTPIGSTTLYDTTEFEFAVTTEVVNFDEGSSANDLKIGVWFDGTLYNETYIYFRNVVVESANIYMDIDVQSCTSPLVTSQTILDEYRVVTPATFGAADQVNVSGGINYTTPAEERMNYDLDKTVFCADLRYTTNADSRIAYLYNKDGRPMLWVRLTGGSSSLLLYNRKLTGDTNLYVGGQYTENGYQQGDYAPIASMAYGTIPWKETSVGNSFHVVGLTLWITTEFVEFDGDGNKDDLQIGIWINGELFRGTYYYYVDYEETTCQGMLGIENMTTVTSPMVEPDDLGLGGGEYASSTGEFYLSDLAASKIMNGTTLQTDILFNGAGGSLYYGCSSDDSEKAIKLTSTEEGILLTHTYGESEETLIVFNEKNLGVDVIDNVLSFKLSTDIADTDADGTADDIMLGVKVNGKTCSFAIADAAPMLTAKLGIKSTDGASVIVGRISKEAPEEFSYSIDEGGYTKAKTESMKRLSVNGVSSEGDVVLNECGTYSVTITEGKTVSRENVIIYMYYDVNENGTVEIRDFVRMLKIANNSALAKELSRAGQLAIAYENADTWSKDIAVNVLEFMRGGLVGAEKVAAKTGKLTMINREQLGQFENKNGAFSGGFTFTADLASDSISRENQIWILSTNAKYVSMNGDYPTIQFKLEKANGAQLYISQPYKIGEHNTYVERQWRLPETLEDYTTLRVSVVIPAGVTLYIEDMADKNNEVGSLSSEDVTVYSEDDGVKYLAHSGYIGYAPDNTLLGFEIAGKMGFKSLITIPKFTSDGVGVCFHDEQIQDRLRYAADGRKITAGDPYYGLGIEDLTFEQLQTLDAGIRSGEAFKSPVPTLEQYFDICDRYKMAPVFSIHPNLTDEQWLQVKEMLLNDKYEKEANGKTWIYNHFQIKAGETSWLKSTFKVFGFEIGGYIMIQPATYGTDDMIYVLGRSGLVTAAEEQGIDLFDKVSVEVFNSAENLEQKLAFYKEYGFKTISLAPTFGLGGGFTGEQMRYFIELGVNSFTVDFHGSMGLDW